jgi:hypothetical protein
VPAGGLTATSGDAYGGYGDINVKLGEVYRMGASYAKICYNQAYEAVGWFWNIFSTEPSAAVTTENILGASAADPAVLAAARVDTKDAAGNDAPDIQLTGVAAGTTTVSYPIQDYAFHSVTQTAQQKVTVVGDLASMSLAGLSNATVGGAAALQLDAGTEQTLPKPAFTWVDGVPGIDSYQYYLCGDPAVATLTKNADGTTVLKATGTGTITLIAESTACRSNAAGCSWERLYADSEGYAKYAEIQVYVAESGIVGLQETGGHNGDSLFCRTNHPLGLTMQPVAASGASLPEGWYVQWTLTTSQPNAASITTSEADGRGTCTLTATNPDATGTLTASVYANGALCAQKQYALTFRLSGDCYDANGTVDVRDLLAAACQISGKAQLAGTNLLAADTNDDGTVDVVDLTRIAKFADGEADPSAAP